MRQISSRTIQRFSIAGLVIVLIYLVVISVVNTNQTQDILDRSVINEEQHSKEQTEQLDEQKIILEETLLKIEELDLQLNTAVLQIAILLDQLEELGVQPRIDPTTVPVPGPRGPTGPAGVPAPTTTTTIHGNNNPPDPDEKEKKDKDK